jgi:electron transport complex protein RnfG
MRETMKLAVRLMIFALVAALLLAVVNELTEDRIAQNTADKINAARKAVIGDYAFEDAGADIAEATYIKGVYTACSGDALVGYVYEMEASGYGGTIYLSAGILTDGTVSGVKVSSHAETKGLGTDAETEFLASFERLNAGVESAADVDAMTGATVSSNAVIRAVNEAMEHFAANYGGEGASR